MKNYVKNTISVLTVSMLAVATLSACGNSEESVITANNRGDTDTNVSSGSNENSEDGGNNENSENTEDNQDGDSEKVQEKKTDVVESANKFYNDLVSFDYPDTPENRDNANNRFTYNEVESALGAPIFTNPEFAYDVRISLNDLDQGLVSDVNVSLEREYNSGDRSFTNYDNLTLAEKVLYNTILGVLKKEVSLVDVGELKLNPDSVEFDDNGDAIIKSSHDMFESSDFSSIPLRLYQNSKGEWIVDTVDFISLFFSPTAQ